MANIRWKLLNTKQRNAVFDLLQRHIPHHEFEILNGRPVNKGLGGSAADFTEISVEGLFDLVAQAKFGK
jgi:hypothetical protein